MVKNCLDQMKFFLEKRRKGKSNFYAYWSTRFNGFDKGANGLTLYKKFFKALLEIINSLGGDGYMADGLVVWGRVIGWLGDKRYLDAVSLTRPDIRDSSIAWRTHTACWASRLACNVQGDFLEIGCYEGYSASVLREFLGRDFTAYWGSRQYFWFDRFHGGGCQKSIALDQTESLDICQRRASRFSDVEIIVGNVLETLVDDDRFASRKFAFVHFDLNDFEVEFEVLKFVMERVVKGGVLLFDDFSMVPFSTQNALYRKFFKSCNLEVLELPTGQGLVVV